MENEEVDTLLGPSLGGVRQMKAGQSTPQLGETVSSVSTSHPVGPATPLSSGQPSAFHDSMLCPHMLFALNEKQERNWPTDNYTERERESSWLVNTVAVVGASPASVAALRSSEPSGKEQRAGRQ
ncbi:hypothetical protein MDA_GLEAN10025758 [Myotis davidii]|uniref:Uncharacterized protein n=1 Tax=Myotis davidii TaxID=225400 RepID=L5LQR6_MYODS|nr:hypothetical protein MDA_GLEAN10025758 [Myotis davidii]